MTELSAESDSRAVIIPEEAAGERLDRALAALLPELSRSRLQRLIAGGAVRVDGMTAKKASQPVAGGEHVDVRVDESPAGPPAPRSRPIALDVLHEDDVVVVVDKPAGLVVHAGAGHRGPTLVDALLYRYGDSLSQVGGAERPGLVHRLDKGTSGVLVVARTDDAHRALASQFAERTVEKLYDAVVYGTPDETEGVIDVSLGRDRADRTRISPRTDRPREALTGWRLHESFGGWSWLQVRPRTGRTHQVRAHLASLHHPCVGDPKYAGAQWKGAPSRWLRDLLRGFGRPALHARRLALTHPVSGERLSFEAPLPADLGELIDALRRFRDQR